MVSVQTSGTTNTGSQRHPRFGRWLLAAFGAAVLSGQSSQPIKDQPPTRSPALTDRDPQPVILDGDAYDKMLRAGVSLKPAFESEPYHWTRALLGARFV